MPGSAAAGARPGPAAAATAAPRAVGLAEARLGLGAPRLEIRLQCVVQGPWPPGPAILGKPGPLTAAVASASH